MRGMSQPRISVVMGTRPEAIKLSPVVRAFRADGRADVRVCVTGQHREMVDGLLPLFGIAPDADLKLMQPGQSLNALASRATAALDEWFEAEQPALVLVQGDTTTAFAAAFAAYCRRIPVAHVEAGLRTGDLYAPWPEEGNRKLIAQVAALHFAPTESARASLERENITAGVHVVGNTGIDALLFAREQLLANPPRIVTLPEDLQPGVAGRRVVLITGHRREHFGDGMEELCGAIRELAARFSDVVFVYPVHLNPNVREPVERLLRGDAPRNILLLEPLRYFEFVALMERSALILTDSGGVQEEAPSLGKRVVVFREKTERPEAVAAGTAILVGPHKAAIVSTCESLLNSGVAPAIQNPYGDGHSAPRIVDACLKYLDRK